VLAHFDIVVITAVLSMVLWVRIAEATPAVGHRPLVAEAALPSEAPSGPSYPLVSIHLPCRNEPPEVVIATVQSLLALDYPRFEVVVVDNNTTDDRLWRPLEAFCATAGPKVKFFHVERLEGFKAGALNYALERSDPATLLVALVDADYIVDPSWLKTVVPFFARADVAGVQAPQAYRDFEGDTFRRLERDEYLGFFRIGMVQRNEANAIIEHGTMLVLRRSVLEAVGRWATWCIVEDAELGLRILAAGHRLIYFNRELGWGLVPPTFREYARQRERWAYGAVRIVAHHWRQVLGLRPGLTWRQRYHFLGGWLPWFAEVLHPVFSLMAAFVAGVILLDRRAAPALEYAYPLIGFTGLVALSTTLAYRARVGTSWRRTLAILAIGAALTPTIARSVLRGVLSSRFAFNITAKVARAQLPLAPRYRRGLAIAVNGGMGLILVGSAALLVATFGWQLGPTLWATALVCQSMPSAFAAWCHYRY
jgi:cellulose synthase/poly-beta-1,6-N-acetylglucosamine synthase-like glycosyltransferase